MLTRSISSIAATLLLFSAHLAQAQVAAPSRGGEVNVTAVTATTMELRFGMLGTGQGRAVAVAAIPDGAPVPLGAADGTFYIGNPVYGQGSVIGKGYIVYCGPEHTATITGLKPGTKYFITNAEYNTDGVSIAYNILGSSIAVATRPTTATALATTPGADRRVEVYPNPSTSQAVSLEVQGYANEPLALRLTDVLGRPVWEQALTPTVANYQAPLPLPASLAAGTYLLTVAGSSGQLQKRLTITE